MNWLSPRMRLATLLIATVFLGACLRTHEFMGNEVPQVQRHEPSWRTIKEYVRSMTMHEGFETRAHFDALWMSDRMRHVYSALHANRIGQNPNEHKAHLLRQLEENKHKIVIYVLAEISSAYNRTISDPQSIWSLYLQTPQGYRIAPTSIKDVDIEPEVRTMFGHRAAPSKKTYRVVFPAKDVAGRRYFAVDDTMELVASAAEMSDAVSWIIPSRLKSEAVMQEYALKTKPRGGGIFGQLKDWGTQERDEDFYW